MKLQSVVVKSPFTIDFQTSSSDITNFTMFLSSHSPTKKKIIFGKFRHANYRRGFTKELGESIWIENCLLFKSTTEVK